MFLDPPFDADLLEPACAALEAGGWLTATAWIYLEAAAGWQPALPVGWTLHREKTAGMVAYRLARREVSALVPDPSPAGGYGE